MSDVKAIFWDNDGVLVDTEQLYFETTRQTIAPTGIDLTEAEFVELFLVQGRGAWHLLEERGVPLDEIDRLRDLRNATYAAELERAPRLVPGITDVLDAPHGRSVIG